MYNLKKEFVESLIKAEDALHGVISHLECTTTRFKEFKELMWRFKGLKSMWLGEAQRLEKAEFEIKGLKTKLERIEKAVEKEE